MTDPITELCQLIAEQLRDNPELSSAALAAQVEATNPELAAALKNDGRVRQLNRDGSQGFQTSVQGGVANIGTHYHVDAEKLGEVLQAVLHRMQTAEVETVDFQSYLQSLCDDDDYREWQDLYTPTTVEGRTPSPQAKSSRRLKLRVETVEPSKEETAGASEPERREQVEQFDVLDGLKKYASEHVLLIGKPGSGKSTSLEWLLWTEANYALDNPTAKIPVLVKLRRCTSTIEGLIQDFLSQHQLSLNLATLEYLLKQGKLLLLLDGLNELPEAFRTEIANFRDKYRKTTPMIVSTRDLSVGGTLDIAKTLTMLPLTEPQMQDFLRGYLGEAGERLFQQLKGDRLQKFAETPLLLWMLCRVFAQNGQVPANLGLAFREFTQLTYPEIQQDAPTNSIEQWPKLLRHLAFALMHDQKPTGFRLSMSKEEAQALLTECLIQEERTNAREPAESWLKDLLQYQLVYEEIQPNFEVHVRFSHQLIQEYYAAEYLLRLLPALSDEHLKRDYLNYLKWTEPIALMLALVDDEAQALRVVKLAMDEVDLILGARLSGDLNLNSQRQVIKKIRECSLASQTLKVELFGLTRSSLAIPYLLPYLGDDDFDLQYTLNKAFERINSDDLAIALIKLLDDRNPMTRIASIAALANIPSQQVVQALRDILKHTSPETRWSAAEALGSIGNSEAEEELILALSDPSPNVVRQAAKALGKLASNKAIPLIFEKLQESDYLSGIDFAYALAGIENNESIISLVKFYLEKEDSFDFIVSAIRQAEIPQKAISMILESVNLEYKPAQFNAILAVGELNLRIATPSLMALAYNEDCEIQGAAIEALGKLKAFEAKDLLIEKLESRNYWTVAKAAIAIGRLNAKEAIPKLRSLLYDKDDQVRGDVIYALSLMDDIEACEGILDAFEDDSSHIRRIAVSVLKSRFLEKVTHDTRIFSILRSENDNLAVSDALEILGRSQFDSKFLVLEEFLVHPSSTVRRGAINGLRFSSARKAVDILREKILCNLIDNYSVILDNDFTFLEAAYAVGEIGGSEDLSFLTKIFRKTGKEYFLEAISSIQNRCQFYNYEILQEVEKTIQNAKLEVQKSKRGDASEQTINQFPNATEVKIFERVERYYEQPPDSNP
jgi:HEAT repeat protein